MTPEDLVEIELIKQLKYKYLRCLDQKLWDDLDQVLTPDCVARYSGGKYSFDGRDAIKEFLVTSMGSTDFLSAHRCVHPEIELTSATTATGIWSLFDHVIILEHDVNVSGSAWYHDDYVKTDDGWRIANTGYKRMFEELTPRGSVPGLSLTAHWWNTDGMSSLG
jgi:hypothetical protein